METISFVVRGNGNERHEVRFSYKDGLLEDSCDCGPYPTVCRHRLRLMKGDASEVVSGNGAQVRTVAAWAKAAGYELDYARPEDLAERRLAVFEEFEATLETYKNLVVEGSRAAGELLSSCSCARYRERLSGLLSELAQEGL